MSRTTVARNPFARGEYSRMSHPRGECSWCGRERNRLFSYLWWGDAAREPTEPEHHYAKRFCALDCFRAYHGA